MIIYNYLARRLVKSLKENSVQRYEYTFGRVVVASLLARSPQSFHSLSLTLHQKTKSATAARDT